MTRAPATDGTAHELLTLPLDAFIRSVGVRRSAPSAFFLGRRRIDKLPASPPLPDVYLGVEEHRDGFGGGAAGTAGRN